MRQAAVVALVTSVVVPAAGAADLGLALKAGTNTSWAQVSGPSAFDTDSGTGLLGGLGLPIRLNDRWSLEPGLLYGELQFSSPSFEPEARISSRAVLLPVPVKLHWNASGAVSPHVAIGPQLAFIGRTRQSFGGAETDVSDDVRDLDCELLLGAGLAIHAGRGRVTLELRHAIGLRNLDETENEIKVRSLQLLVGYQF